MDPDTLDFDAVILAGGRSSRLGGVPKQGLTYDGETLLSRSAAAARGARSAVVVGPDTGAAPAGFLWCREEPPFGGPAAAVAAGLAALAAAGGTRPRLTLLLACDMPKVAEAVAALKDALRFSEPTGTASRTKPDGVVALSEDGRRQPLVGFYSTAALQRSVAEMEAGGRLINGSVRALLASLDVHLVAVPPGSTADVDTWEDAAAVGVDGLKPTGRFRGNIATDDLGGKA